MNEQQHSRDLVDPPFRESSRGRIFLIGLMGSGKSFWARKLSTALGIPAFDLDTEIEKMEGKTVAAIFAEKGEDRFRTKENEVLKSFASNQRFLLATGGGSPCFFDNMDWMNENGITIWLDEPIKIIAKRLQKQKLHRPLIASVEDDSLEDFLTQMRDKRKPFYAKAKYQLTGNISEKDFLKIISLNE
jgi:shikimate kinase